MSEIKKEADQIKLELKKQTSGYIVAAFGFVAGLAWNEAIKAAIDFLFPLGQNTILAKFLYAIIITVLVVVATFFLLRSQREKK